jgi:hypothetical protein
VFNRISPKTFRYSPIKSMMEIAMKGSDPVFSGSYREGGIEGQP